MTALVIFVGCSHYSAQSPKPLKTQIVTFPPGGAIKINGRYLGVSPVEVTLPQDAQRRITETVTIEAEPRRARQHPQARVISQAGTNAVPIRIMIDMRSATPPEKGG